MKKILFWLCLLCTIQLSAQDHILTLKQDTLKVKVNSIDKQKIVYYLNSDTDKKLQEMPVADLHKIIWRTGQEYIINQVFEDSLKKLGNDKVINNPIAEAQKVESKPQISEVEEAIAHTQPSAPAPEICQTKLIFWRIYCMNGVKVDKNAIRDTLAKYDFETYQKFKRGHEKWRLGSHLLPLATVATAVSVPMAIRQSGLGKSHVLFAIVLGVDIATVTQLVSGVRIMRAAIAEYETKRRTNRLKGKETKIPF